MTRHDPMPRRVLALEQLIQFLRAEVQRTPVDGLTRLAREASWLRTVSVNDTSIAVASLAASARALIHNLPFAHKTAVPALRAALLALSDALAAQAATLKEHATPEDRDETIPYWNRD
jgi:hypothetical protein